MNAPIDLATRETVEFLAARLAPQSRVLEVGCGEGDVALALCDLGHAVLALDEDPETAERASRRGAPGYARWPDYDGAPVDAVRVHALAPSHRSASSRARAGTTVDRSRRRAAGRGLRVDRADLATIVWFHEVVRQHRGDLVVRRHGLDARCSGRRSVSAMARASRARRASDAGDGRCDRKRVHIAEHSRCPTSIAI